MTHRYATGLLGLLSAVFLLSLGSSGGPVAGDDADEYQNNDFDASERNQEDSVLQTRPVLLIPGFASTQLNAWKKVSCKNSFQKNLYRDVNIGDRLWIDVARILAQGDCWVQCMKLHMVNQSEVECKLRAGEGTSAISELDPGIVTGPLSNVWGSMIRDLIDQFELGPEQLIVAPYDWRLPPSKMQERDNYFYSLMKKSTIFSV
ncbi:Phospholipid sterol acyl transferase 1, partial [Globisporangium splendens]